MSLYQNLMKEVDNGLIGRNGSIPFPIAKLDQYLEIAKNTNYLLVGDTGCLSGDTEIVLERMKHKGRAYTIEELYYKYKDIKNPNCNKPFVKWQKGITKSLCYSYKEDIVYYNDILDVYQSGVKEIFKISTESGKTIKSTKDHRFLIDKNDIFKTLEELKKGDFIFVKQNNYIAKGRKKRPYRYEIITKMPYYPSARDKKVTVDGVLYIHQRIKKTRAVYDAYINNVTLEFFLEQVKSNPVHGFIFSDLKMDLHHIDENPHNDVPENLKLISKEEHARLHGKDGRSKHLGNRDIIKDKIVSIELIGEEMTYDISMKSPDNNFIANGFVVHNSGKSSGAQDLILNTLDWYYDNQSEDLKLSIIYFGMERKLYMYSAKWISRMIFLKEKILIPVKKILGRRRLNGKIDNLTTEEYKLVEQYAQVFNKWEENDTFLCVEGTHNPTGLKIYIDDFAKKHGKLTARKEGEVLGKSTYEPNHPNHIVLIVTDYVGVLDPEKDENGQKKLRLDKFSWIMKRARDLYGYSPINIQQLSRAVTDYTRLKLNDLKPKLSDIADTSELGRDADVVIAIYEPFRYVTQDVTKDILGYDLTKLRDRNGYKYYRSIHILKSSFDGDGITIGAAFHPQTGIIKAMPELPDNMKDSDYESITNGSYFIKNTLKPLKEVLKQDSEDYLS